MTAEERRRPADVDPVVAERLDGLMQSVDRRFDDLKLDLQGFREDMTRWRTEVVSKEVYDADERTRSEIVRRLEDADTAHGVEIVDLKAEATRRARERRALWGGVVAAFIGGLVSSVAAIVIALGKGH